MDTTTIIGYVLFAISEILPLLPIPTNGVFHSLTIGLKNSIKNSNNDIEVAQNVLKQKPDIANIVNLETKLFEYRKMLYRNSRDNNRAQIILH
jgi:hypothetical protein